MAKYKLQKWVLNGLTRYRDRQSDGGIRQSSGRNDSRLIQSPGVQLPTEREKESGYGVAHARREGGPIENNETIPENFAEREREPRFKTLFPSPLRTTHLRRTPKASYTRSTTNCANAAIIGKVAVVVTRGHFSFVEMRHGRSKGCGYWIVLRLADVHPSVEKGSVRIWPFAATPPSSTSRLVGSARVAATGIGNRSGEVRRGRRSFARDRYHSAGYLLSPRARKSAADRRRRSTWCIVGPRQTVGRREGEIRQLWGIIVPFSFGQSVPPFLGHWTRILQPPSFMLSLPRST